MSNILHTMKFLKLMLIINRSLKWCSTTCAETIISLIKKINNKRRLNINLDFDKYKEF